MSSIKSKGIHLSQPVTPSRMAQLRKAFAEFDRNADGSISKDELSSVMKNFGGMTTEKELKEMINQVDKDGDGAIDFKEFLNLMDNNCLVQTADEEIMSLFSAIDSDKDGFITKDEVGKMMKKLGENIRKKDIRKMVKEADKNKDGRISFNEFKGMVEKFNLNEK